MSNNGNVKTGVISAKRKFLIKPDPLLANRIIYEMTFSSMPAGEDFLDKRWRENPAQFTFLRDDEVLKTIDINPRASFRYVISKTEAEWVFDERQEFSVIVNVSYRHTNLSMELSNHTRSQFWSESRRWVDSRMTLSCVTHMSGKWLKGDK